ncbi:MAG: hypothetical protein K9J37_20145 [Saprospiraceae bacterium]|nr:hypothetical protein [Saprospiraceae bacterium]MCF8252239.1 hypothetical protein [Saprospiraceae bacterium]MCF8282354.1 hypothetical protein [Bacteroidales bacterium]MCF8313881.1 hypothetical protein [Saprospiraceae bacterium]MCF8442900.1 hypothetical protein [Saprospiraceae bacterium]
MAKKYGVTWWGQQWLQSLTLIDYNSRLPRGRALASTGKVRSIDIKGNQIIARVQGAQTEVVRVSISVPLFNENEKEKFIEALAKENALILRLIKLELPNELKPIADKQGIRLFPESWKDFSMQCSCGDFSTPCEHLAAVIFEIAEEIDKNQFMVFEMHEMNLMKELEAYHQRLETKKSEEVAKVVNLLDIPASKGEFMSVTSGRASKPLKPQALDFTTIPEAGTQILMLYRANEFFNGVEIKEVLHQCYADASDTADELLGGDVETQILPFRIFPEDHLQLVFDENLRFKQLLISDISGRQHPLPDFRPEDLVQLLYTYNFGTLNRTHPNTEVLLHVFSFALNMAKNGAIMPQLLECAPGKYRARWVPAQAVVEVREFFEKLAPSLAPDLMFIEKRSTRRTQPAAEMLNSICSFFIGYCVAAKAEHDERPLVQLFQNTAENSLQVFDNQEVVQQIHRWLNNFYTTKKDYVPVVKVDETNGLYSVDLVVEYRPTPLMPPIPLNVFLNQKKYEVVKEDVMKDMALLLEFFPQLDKVLESEGRKQLIYNPTRFMEVLLKNLPAIEIFGIKTLLPAGMKESVRPQLSLNVDKLARKKSDLALPFEQQFSFDWQVALGDVLISIDEFEKLVSSENGVVKLDKRYVLVDEDQLISLFDKLEEPPKLDYVEALHVLFTKRYRGAKIGLTNDAEDHLQSFLAPREVMLPKRLNAELLDHQLTGYDWLMKNARHGFGSLLADEVGLGKTVQVIAALLKFKEEGLLEMDKVLIVSPASMLASWQIKLRQFAPTLVTAVYHGKKRPLGVTEPDVIVTSYETANTEAELLEKMPWYCIVADEAQWVSDAGMEDDGLKSLPATVRIGIIGRFIEHRLGELWSIMDFLNHDYLGSRKQFMNQYEHPILREHDQRRAVLLSKIVAPFMLRRLKNDKEVAPTLPPQLQSDAYAMLSTEQEEMYRRLVQRDMKLMLEEKEVQRRQTIVLAFVKDLRKICNHPYQFSRTGAKVPRLSGKAQLLLSLLENNYENGEKTLILTQFPETGEILTKAIKDAFGKEPLFIHDALSMVQRDEVVFAFQKNPVFDTLVMVATPTHAGQSLTAATSVILFDRWWNPALESQLVERASRISQSKTALLWRLTTAFTFEERLDELLRSNKELQQLTLAAGENWIGELTVAELEWVFG